MPCGVFRALCSTSAQVHLYSFRLLIITTTTNSRTRITPVAMKPEIESLKVVRHTKEFSDITFEQLQALQIAMVDSIPLISQKNLPRVRNPMASIKAEHNLVIVALYRVGEEQQLSLGDSNPTTA